MTSPSTSPRRVPTLRLALLCLALFVALPVALRAGDKSATDAVTQLIKDLPLALDAYEPNQIGFTQDKENDFFMDFTLSVMIQVVPFRTPAVGDTTDRRPVGFRFLGAENWKWIPFGAVTVRSGQYIGTRTSAPVVGKRFNPLFGVRFMNAREKLSFDAVYAHESNGQSIAGPGRFNELEAVYEKIEANQAKAHRIARDNISRGWDYVGLRSSLQSGRFTYSLSLKGFLSYGPVFQKEKEEFSSWENETEGKPRQSVDGLSASLSYLTDHWQTDLTWTTGLKDAFTHHTARFEIGYRFSKQTTNSRVLVWFRHGYNSDLTNYFKRGASAGVAVAIWQPSPRF